MNNISAGKLLERVRKEKPVVHHLTNWVTIYDCANIVKVFGASPVMAHAVEEAADMASIASALVLNIGTLTVEMVEAMKIAAESANKKGIPVVLDACGAGATRLRDEKCFELLEDTRVDIVKGNASEIARLSGLEVRTKGVDSGDVMEDLFNISENLSSRYNCVTVITGKEDMVTAKGVCYTVSNGHPFMSAIVGTGCMAASVIGMFAAVEKDFAGASAAALSCFGIAAEQAAEISKGPGTFKENLFDCAYNLDQETVSRMQKIQFRTGIRATG